MASTSSGFSFDTSLTPSIHMSFKTSSYSGNNFTDSTVLTVLVLPLTQKLACLTRSLFPPIMKPRLRPGPGVLHGQLPPSPTVHPPSIRSPCALLHSLLKPSNRSLIGYTILIITTRTQPLTNRSTITTDITTPAISATSQAPMRRLHYRLHYMVLGRV